MLLDEDMKSGKLLGIRIAKPLGNILASNRRLDGQLQWRKVGQALLASKEKQKF